MSYQEINPELKEQFEQLSQNMFQQQFGTLFQDLTDLQQDGKVKNVTRTSTGEWRAVVFKDDAIKDTYKEENDWTSYQDIEDGDQILWVAIYANGQRFIVHNKVGVDGYDIIENGNIREYYKGKDITYVANFLTAVGSNNCVLKDPEVLSRFTKVQEIIEKFVPENNMEAVTFLSGILLTVENVGEHDVTWEKAEEIKDGDKASFGIVFKTDSEKILKFQNRRLLVWQAAQVVDTEGNVTTDEEQIVFSSFIINDQTITGVHPNSVGTHVNELEIPSNWKAIIELTVDEADGLKLEELKLFRRGEFNPMNYHS